MGQLSGDQNNNKQHVQDIVKLQKRCARIILGTPLRPLFKELNMLPFDWRLEYLRNILVFKTLNNLAPNYISQKELRLQYLVTFITRA